MASSKTSPPPNDKTVVCVNTPLGSILARWESIEAPASASTLREAESGRESGIIKCLNVPYADIPYRWAAPQIQTSTKPWGSTRDCTKFGPGCPQIKGPTVQVAGVPMFGTDSPFPHRAKTEDEFQCLNLNIYAPGTKTGETAILAKDLPVLVWVYGGAYQVGSASVDAYDGTELVRRSIEIGCPVIVVTVNYRVGVLGFLHSRQLVASTGSSTGNLGLLDCRCAFDWLRDNIQHFGGDPRQLTAIGESAGAGTIHHLMTVPQLYVDVSRVILSSSTCMSIQLQRAEEAQRAFDNICQKLGVDANGNASAVVDDLRAVSVDRLVESAWSMNATFRPIWDDITIKADPREVAFRPELWNPALQSVIMGTCENEPWLREAVILANNKIHDFDRTISGRIPPVDDLRQRAAQIYADNNDNSFPWYKPDDELNVPTHNRRVMAFEGHCKYNTPGVFFAQSFLKSKPRYENTPTVYRYVFNYKTAHWPDHWPVTHTADILPMFLHKSLNETDRRVSGSFADQLLGFTSGQPPPSWKQYAAGSHVLNVLGRDGAWSVEDEADDTVFDLTEGHVQFWTDVLKAILATGRSGWPEMGR